MENILSHGREKIIDGVVYSDGVALAIMVPSVVFGLDDKGVSYVSGPKRIIRIVDLNEESVWSALIESGSLVFGASDEIEKTKEKLQGCRTSRTASYVLGQSSSCKEFLVALDSIDSLRVLIVGCGGIGSLAALNIIGAGVRSITLVDGDRIEKSNLNRQFFWEEDDIGEFKVDKLKVVINNRFDSIKCETENRFLSEDEIKERANEHDVIVITADEPLGLGDNSMTSMLKKEGKLVISSGYFHSYLSIEAKTKPDRQADEWSKRIKWRRNPSFIGPSFGPSNTELAGLIASLAINYIIKKSQGGSVDVSFQGSWDSTQFPRKSLMD